MKKNVEYYKARFDEAESLYCSGSLERASEIYLEVMAAPPLTPLCLYRMAAISNRSRDAKTACDLYYKAFTTKPDVLKSLFPQEHPGSSYVFPGRRDEILQENCPLCGARGEPYWCYVLPEASGFSFQFNPVRVWLHCEKCSHLFAEHFPEKLFLHNNSPRLANPAIFPLYSAILSRIAQFTSGDTLLEVGIGACECALTAREMGYDVFGLDVIERHVVDAREKYGLAAETHDFNMFETDRKWDVIMMGDVLEHVLDPVKAIEKAHGLLNDGGALWISTPNFQSAFSDVSGHNDPMRRQTFHLNYFSRVSLYRLLMRCGFTPVDYTISAHYNGSMEVIAVKA